MNRFGSWSFPRPGVRRRQVRSARRIWPAMWSSVTPRASNRRSPHRCPTGVLPFCCTAAWQSAIRPACSTWRRDGRRRSPQPWFCRCRSRPGPHPRARASARPCPGWRCPEAGASRGFRITRRSLSRSASTSPHRFLRRDRSRCPSRAPARVPAWSDRAWTAEARPAAFGWGSHCGSPPVRFAALSIDVCAD